MPSCRCDTSTCTSCACAKENEMCTESCHGGKPMENVPCMNTEQGKKVKTMKIKDVRTALISADLSIIGDRGIFMFCMDLTLIIIYFFCLKT